MRKIIAAIYARLERNVTAKNDWHIGREDGTSTGWWTKCGMSWRTKRHGCR